MARLLLLGDGDRRKIPDECQTEKDAVRRGGLLAPAGTHRERATVRYPVDLDLSSIDRHPR